MRRPHLVAASGGLSLLRCAGFLLWRLLLLQSTGSRCAGLSSCGSWSPKCKLSSCGARAQLLHGTWDPPRPGLKPVSPKLAGRLLTTAPPGKPCTTSIKGIWQYQPNSLLHLPFHLLKLLMLQMRVMAVNVWLILEQRRGVRNANPWPQTSKDKNPVMTLQSAPHVPSSTWKNSTNHGSCITVVKNPSTSGPAQFKSMLFKGQLYLPLIQQSHFYKFILQIYMC